MLLYVIVERRYESSVSSRYETVDDDELVMRVIHC